MEILLAILVFVFLYLVLGLLNPVSGCDIRHVAIAANVDESGNVVEYKIFSAKDRILRHFYRHKNIDLVTKSNKYKFKATKVFFFDRQGQLCVWVESENKAYVATPENVETLFKLISVNMADIYNFLSYIRVKGQALHSLEVIAEK